MRFMKKLDKLPAQMNTGQKLVGCDGFGCMNSGLATVLARPHVLNGDYIVCCDADYTDAKRFFMRNPDAKRYDSDIASFQSMPAFRCSSYRWACAEFTRRDDKMANSREADATDFITNRKKALAGDMQAALNLADYL